MTGVSESDWIILKHTCERNIMKILDKYAI